jgi:hypothetical protein
MKTGTLLKIKEFSSDLTNTFITLLRIPLMWRPVKKFPQPERKELLILGNGPSLNDFLTQHKDFAAGKDVMAVNMFSLTDAFEQMKPAKYVIAAPEFWLNPEDEYEKQRKQMFVSLAEKTTWPLDFFIPVAAKNKGGWEQILKPNPNIRIVFYNTMPVEGFRFFRYFLFDRRFGMPRPHNVIIPSVMNAVLSGYEKIYITGIDHDWLKYLHVTDDNQAVLIQKHFYDKPEELKPGVMRKFGKEERKMHEILQKFMLAFKGYHELNEYAGHKNVRIYNITPDSLVDAFERMKL